MTLLRTLALALLLTGCTTMDALYDQSRWVYDGMETATYTWQNNPAMKAACGIQSTGSGNWGCAIRLVDPITPKDAKPVPGATIKTGHCYILSNVSEEDAKRIQTTTGEDLRSHELKHCKGYRHP